jgi:hypothetical protein
MKTWELAFEPSGGYRLQPVIDVFSDFEWSLEYGDDYIYEVYDHDGDCMWAEGDDISIREALPQRILRILDARCGTGKPVVIVGDAVKIPFPRSSHVRS